MLSQTKMQLWYPRQTSEERINQFLNSSVEKFGLNTSKRKRSFESDKSEDNDFIDVDTLSDEDFLTVSSRALSPVASEEGEDVTQNYKIVSSIAKRYEGREKVSDFVDLSYWRKEKLCCGTIFKGAFGEIMVDSSLIKPCVNRRAICKSNKD